MKVIKRKIRLNIALFVWVSGFCTQVFCELKQPEVKKSETQESQLQSLPVGTKVGTWTKVNAGSGNENLKLQRIAVGNMHNVWAISELESGKDNAQIYQLGRDSEDEEEKWVLKESGIDVSAAADGTVVIIKKVDGKNRLFKRKVENGKEIWEPIFPDVELTRVTVSSDDALWGVFKQGDRYKAYYLKDDKLQPLKTIKGDDASGFVMFALAESEDGQDVVFAIDAQQGIYRFDTEMAQKIEKTKELRKSKDFKDRRKKRQDKKKKEVRIIESGEHVKKIENKKKKEGSKKKKPFPTRAEQ